MPNQGLKSPKFIPIIGPHDPNPRSSRHTQTSIESSPRPTFRAGQGDDHNARIIWDVEHTLVDVVGNDDRTCAGVGEDRIDGPPYRPGWIMGWNDDLTIQFITCDRWLRVEEILHRAHLPLLSEHCFYRLLPTDVLTLRTQIERNLVRVEFPLGDVVWIEPIDRSRELL